MPQPKIALVTGGNKGIGFEICRQLAKQGCHVLLGARNETEGKDAVSQLFKEIGKVQFQYLDLERPDTFIQTRDSIEREFGELDILVNNAAIALDWNNTVDTVPLEVIRSTFETNFFATIELTQVLLPLLMKSTEGRIVNQSSILGSLTLHSPPHRSLRNEHAFAYNASKTALNAFTVHLAKILANTNIKVNSSHPGSVKTSMNPGGTLDLIEGAQTAVKLALLPYDGPTGKFFHLDTEIPW